MNVIDEKIDLLQNNSPVGNANAHVTSLSYLCLLASGYK
jgi:hypothetical protein